MDSVGVWAGRGSTSLTAAQLRSQISAIWLRPIGTMAASLFFNGSEWRCVVHIFFYSLWLQPVASARKREVQHGLFWARWRPVVMLHSESFVEVWLYLQEVQPEEHYSSPAEMTRAWTRSCAEVVLFIQLSDDKSSFDWFCGPWSQKKIKINKDPVAPFWRFDVICRIGQLPSQ